MGPDPGIFLERSRIGGCNGGTAAIDGRGPFHSARCSQPAAPPLRPVPALSTHTAAAPLWKAPTGSTVLHSTARPARCSLPLLQPCRSTSLERGAMYNEWEGRMNLYGRHNVQPQRSRRRSKLGKVSSIHALRCVLVQQECFAIQLRQTQRDDRP